MKYCHKHYSEQIKCLIEESGKTRSQIAKEAGISEGTIRHIENKRCKPKPETLSKIATAFNVDAKPLIDSWTEVHLKCYII